jgi:hypothetical protein
LRRLNLVIETDFQYDQQRKPINVEFYCRNEDVWEDPAALLRIKKSLKITVTRLVSCWDTSVENELNHQRFLRTLKRRLGI